VKPLTIKQRDCLKLLDDGPLGTGEIAYRTHVSIDAAHSRMRNLEDRLMVRRIQQGLQGNIEWELTRLGRKEI
jgi:DNA-binding CsgD family transcriptional regulator